MPDFDPQNPSKEDYDDDRNAFRNEVAALQAQVTALRSVRSTPPAIQPVAVPPIAPPPGNSGISDVSLTVPAGFTASNTASNALAVSTDLTGLVKSDATSNALTAATPGTDYVHSVTAGTGITNTGTAADPVLETAGGAGMTQNTSVVAGGDTIANTSGLTAFASKITLDHTLFAVGSKYRLSAFGTYGTAALPPNFVFAIYWNSTGTPVQLLLSESLLSVGSAVSGRFWHVDAEFTIFALGATGKVMGGGIAETHATASAVIPAPMVITGTTGVTQDTTADAIISVLIDLGTADPANTITMQSLSITKQS